MISARPILLSTVGTSLIYPNLNGLQDRVGSEQLTADSWEARTANAFARSDAVATAKLLSERSPQERICGAEINSVASLIDRQYVTSDCGLYFLHSDTDEGRWIAAVLAAFYKTRGHSPVKTVQIDNLQDEKPQLFRTLGLRNLARRLCRILRDHSPQACVINATGGYKAQIAIAVLIGQAIGVPVYYKHERFDEIIAFPPMPIGYDFDLWLKANGMLFLLDGSADPLPADQFADDWDDRCEVLVERVEIDGADYLELSPTGQIFHETFQHRFEAVADKWLPPLADKKRPPKIEDAGWRGVHPEIERFMQAVTDEIPQVVFCNNFNFNPDQPNRTQFRVGSKGLEGIYSNGTYCDKFRIETTAQNDNQRQAVCVVLNQWLAGRKDK